MHEYFGCMYVDMCSYACLVPVDVGKGCQFPGNGVIGHCEPPHRGWELNLVICKNF